MEILARALVISAIILGGAIIVRGLYPADRFAMVAVPGGAFRLDRLTGGVVFCDVVLCRALPIATPVPARPNPLPPKSAASGT